jgi:hypothetical protein
MSPDLLFLVEIIPLLGVATGYELDGCGSISDRHKRFSTCHGVQTVSGDQGPFAGRKAARAKLTINLHILPSSGIVALYLHSHTSL